MGRYGLLYVYILGKHHPSFRLFHAYLPMCSYTVALCVYCLQSQDVTTCLKSVDANLLLIFPTLFLYQCFY